MSYLILVRHGQSTWKLEKKFTGWVNVDLTENGKSEAKKAGNLIKLKNIYIDIYYSSFQLRAKNTLKLIKEILQDTKISKEAWQLNERHYGALTGLNKNNPYYPTNIETYKEIPINKIPDTESLKDTYERVLEFYKQEIENKISNNNILISAHGNSIRALCKYLFKLDENQISKLEIPTGNPLLITLDGNKKITDCKYLDDERAKDLVVF